jgi:hypothetical protein
MNTAGADMSSPIIAAKLQDARALSPTMIAQVAL